MSGLTLIIQNELYPLEIADKDILCLEKVYSNDKVCASSLVYIQGYSNSNISDTVKVRIQFDWRGHSEVITEEIFLFIPETKTLFFRSGNQWAVFNLLNKMTIQHEHAFCHPWLEQIGHFVLIEDELEAYLMTLDGQKINSVPIDPPWQRQDFPDRIEYLSPVYGKQTLLFPLM
ncbi:hypothetical protein QNI19_03795 [Cytophagaceae bacterium DM2B3-1]|uniref:Uncharacterized protein n=1 Tax=Xanthocytophaga flava TaxID=3048013 RepID=A0ABT7CEB4_9BACT|nr:hypothetical protein [Xanthocytophaga flavus]MDJ1468866.1 hypothetical protein [Xanthocytophaga flavus]MDJ1492040.1 hypothetical protein [Xanthocytophaga flavus]